MRRLFLTLAMVLGVAGMTFAQTATSASGVVTVTATVITPVTITSSATLAFGTVYQGYTSTISATSASAAQLLVQGEPNSAITISWNTDAVLADTGSTSYTMPFTASLYGSSTGYGGAGGSLSTATGTSGTLSSSGDYYVTVGGSVDPTSSTPSGSYSTANTTGGGKPLTITVTY